MTTQTAVATRTLEIDRSHSEVAFQVRHLLSKVRGRFTDFAGTIDFDNAHPQSSRIDVTIQAASIDTAESDRDKHLRSADFFEVETFPTLTFTSTSVTPRGDNRYDVAGDLTIHGVTRQVTLPASVLGSMQDPWGNEKFGFEAELTINRKDFGLSWNAALEAGALLVGDEVKVMLSVQAK
ncbi:MAG: polyisoprenoid-binding protein [Acidobacteria bacterium]|nr:MAG: polyisoprenoid-binding protein [Acidobacteriota bacterium]